MAETQTKYCNKCGKEKPLGDFTKNQSKKDGLCDSCKDCKRNFENSYKKNWRINRRDIEPQNCRAGLDSWQQVDNVLREMAESQIAIDKEQTVCNKRIELIKKYSDEIIEPYLTHKMGLEAMLAMFFKKELSGVKTSTRKFSFGKVFYKNGKVQVDLNIELAKGRLGKP
jgi:hypothetical protein